jgi:hypothetical protein
MLVSGANTLFDGKRAWISARSFSFTLHGGAVFRITA